jgi:thiamine biosynthesis lipoprotein ApbE
MGGLVSVTVVTNDATEADALSTIVFLLGREKGMEYIKKTPGLEGILVSSVGDSLQIDLSPGFQGKFHAAK